MLLNRLVVIYIENISLHLQDYTLVARLGNKLINYRRDLSHCCTVLVACPSVLFKHDIVHIYFFDKGFSVISEKNILHD